MTQKLPTQNSYPHIADQIVDQIQKRKQAGIATYGNALQPFNGRDSTQDALEEALDLAHYIKQWQIERDEMVEFIYGCWGSEDTNVADKAFDMLVKIGRL